MHIGCSATRQGLTPRQHGAADNYLVDVLLSTMQGMNAARSVTFHHGDCIKGDALLHDIADKAGFSIVIHPPENSRLRAFKSAPMILPVKPYLVRNRDIVNACTTMLICPDSQEYKIKSGTWYTWKYAKSVNKHVVLITPDGQVSYSKVHEKLGYATLSFS